MKGCKNKKVGRRVIIMVQKEKTFNRIEVLYRSIIKGKDEAATFTAESDLVCEVCQSNQHPLSSCPQFIKLSLNEKWEYVKGKRVCFLCLKRDHRRIDCESSKCVTYTGPHHTFLHNPTKIPRDG